MKLARVIVFGVIAIIIIIAIFLSGNNYPVKKNTSPIPPSTKKLDSNKNYLSHFLDNKPSTGKTCSSEENFLVSPITPTAQTNKIDKPFDTPKKVLMLNGEEPSPEILFLKEQIVLLLSTSQRMAIESVKELLSYRKGGEILEIILLIFNEENIPDEIKELLVESIPDKKSISNEVAEYLIDITIAKPGQTHKYFGPYSRDSNKYLELVLNNNKNNLMNAITSFSEDVKRKIFEYLKKTDIDNSREAIKDKIALIGYLGANMDNGTIFALESILYGYTTDTKGSEIRTVIAKTLLQANESNINERLYNFIINPSSDETVVNGILLQIASNEKIRKEFPYLEKVSNQVYSTFISNKAYEKNLSFEDSTFFDVAITNYIRINRENETVLNIVFNIIDFSPNENTRFDSICSLGQYEAGSFQPKALAKLKNIIEQPIYSLNLKQAAFWTFHRLYDTETINWVTSLLDNPQYKELSEGIKSTIANIQRTEENRRKKH